MTRSVIMSTILSMGIFLLHVIDQRVRHLFYYILIFILMMLAQYFFESTVDGATYCRHSSCMIQKKKLTNEEYKFYEDKKKFHLDNAIRTFNDAKEICWWLPNKDDRQTAKDLFSACVATMSAATLKSKCIAALIAGFGFYGLDCMNEWNTLHNKLYWCEHHYDLYEFYSNLLIDAQKY